MSTQPLSAWGDPSEWPADLRVRQMPDGRNQ
jgi:hypothetical protein